MNIAQKLANFLFPSPRSIPRPEDEDNNKNYRRERHGHQELRGVKEDRCQFTFSDGRRCRSQQAHFCAHHASNKQPITGVVEPEKGVAITPLFGHENDALVALCGDLTSATNINRALAHVYLLMAQGRISQKQAVAFGYLSQLLLQTIPGIRSEYVSAHGYQAWQTHLKSKLVSPLPTPAPLAESLSSEESVKGQKPACEANEQPNIGVVEREKAAPTTALFAHEKDSSAPVSSTQPTAETKPTPPTPPSPDYASLYRRSLDLLDRKFDTTPEGRREAKALMTELEMLNPKPEPVMKKASQTRTTPAVAHTYTPPSLPATTSAPNERDVNFLAPAYPEGHEANRRACPARPDLSRASRESRRGSRAASRRASMPPEAPPSNPRSKRPATTPVDQTAHSTDWYAPASWSAPRPDPYPSRQEKLKRQLCTMSDRRRQHQMQNRAFWH